MDILNEIELKLSQAVAESATLQKEIYKDTTFEGQNGDDSELVTKDSVEEYETMVGGGRRSSKDANGGVSSLLSNPTRKINVEEEEEEEEGGPLQRYTLDEFRNSTSRSAKSAIDALLCSDRVLSQLRSLLLGSYIQHPEKFSLNMRELVEEFAEEEELKIEKPKFSNSKARNVSDFGNGSISSGSQNGGYYLQVDMLEVELANIFSSCPGLFKNDSKSSKVNNNNNKNSTMTNDDDYTIRKKNQVKIKRKSKKKPIAKSSSQANNNTKALLDETLMMWTENGISNATPLKTFYEQQKQRENDTDKDIANADHLLNRSNNKKKTKKRKKKRSPSSGLSRLMRDTASSRAARVSRTIVP